MWSQIRLSACPIMECVKTTKKTELQVFKVSFVNSTLTFDESKTEFDVIVSDKGLKYEYSWDIN